MIEEDFFSIKDSDIIGAVERLFATEASLKNCIYRNEWIKAMHQVERQQENLDYIIHEVGKHGINSMGKFVKMYAYAIVYRATCKKLFRARTPTPMTKERKRYWYNKRDDVRRSLSKMIDMYYDRAAEANGKYILWELMVKRNGCSHVVLSSKDKCLIMVEYNDALRHMQKGEMYFIAKEYKEKDNGVD